jgi:hypothetical protein
MVMGPAGLGTKEDCVGEGQQFTPPNDIGCPVTEVTSFQHFQFQNRTMDNVKETVIPNVTLSSEHFRIYLSVPIIIRNS